MKTVQVAPIRWSRGQGPEIEKRLHSMRATAPALRDFASKQTHDRPYLVAGSLIALGLIPMAAYASRRVFGRHTSMVEALPRNQEWYTGDYAMAPTMLLPRNQEWYAEA
jgi:hypothetical protein